MPTDVRVRFAPSPTGFLHVGGAHTALFNWLFARHEGGTFVLRIEDTDELRNTPEAEQAIKDGLRWLGLDWDEGPDVGGPCGPYLQSERLDLYNEFAQRLIEAGRAYECFCTPEELEQRREVMRARGLPPRYDNRCRNLPAEHVQRLRAEGRACALRFRMREAGHTVIHDLIRGDVSQDNSLLGDLVIRKTSGFPTYHFAVVVDDHLMRITHIIRGEEHLINTVAHRQLQDALGIEPPQYAHLGILLDEKRAKLSKRHEAVDLGTYQDRGILPEAMVNFLALIGWTTGTEEEILSIRELIERFVLDRVSKAPGVFDLSKLEWFNSQHINRAPAERLAELALPVLVEAGLFEADPTPERRQYLLRVIELMRDRMKTINDLRDWASYFFTEDYPYDEQARSKWLDKPETPAILEELRTSLRVVGPWNAEGIEAGVRLVANELGLSGGKVIHPCRAAVTGRTVGPSLFHLLELLPQQTVIARLRRAAGIPRLPKPS